jgi:4-hydroxy-tetrahydrodipicolinate synthase
MLKGCYTALITPFKDGEMDREGLEQLVAFQIKNGTRGILAVGTTGESPVLDWREHNEVTQMVCRLCKGRVTAIAGTGSNCTRESLEATRHAVECGAEAVLLVDPYYNGPSSLEIRREYVAPIANAFPEVEVIPYVIPGRSGTQLLPEDLAMLHAACPNVGTVKEATGDMGNMARTRRLCGEDFVILSGDDDKTFDMMSDPAIRASGVISVTSNIAPRAVQQLTEWLNAGEREKAERVLHAESRTAPACAQAAFRNRHGKDRGADPVWSGDLPGAKSAGRQDADEPPRDALRPVSPPAWEADAEGIGRGVGGGPHGSRERPGSFCAHR